MSTTRLDRFASLTGQYLKCHSYTDHPPHPTTISLPMSRSRTNLPARISLLQPKRFVPGLRNARRPQDDSEEREHLIAEEHATSQLPRRPLSPPQLDARGSTPPDMDDAYLSRCYAQMAQDIIPSLPPTCLRLSPEDVIFISERPIAAGGFTNIHEATHAGRRAVLKSHRCYVSFDIAQVIEVRCSHRGPCRVHY